MLIRIPTERQDELRGWERRGSQKNIHATGNDPVKSIYRSKQASSVINGIDSDAGEREDEDAGEIMLQDDEREAGRGKQAVHNEDAEDGRKSGVPIK